MDNENTVYLTAKEYDEFLAILEQDPKEIPGLKELIANRRARNLTKDNT